jgi:hypothetical protein
MFIYYLFLNPKQIDQKNEHWASEFKLNNIFQTCDPKKYIFLKVVLLTAFSSWNKIRDGLVEDFQHYTPAAR